MYRKTYLTATIALVLALSGFLVLASEASYADDESTTSNEVIDSGENLVISTAEQLIAFANRVNDGADFNGFTVTLTNNITLVEEWTPIGKGERSGSGYTPESTPFRGTFDGGNYTISGLEISESQGEDCPVGLFGIVDGGTVKNLVLENVKITSGKLVGVVAGALSSDGVIENCKIGETSHETCTVTVSGDVGGVVGKIYSDGSVKSCTNYVDISSASGKVGGIVSAAYYKPISKGLNVTNCENNGNLTTGGGYSGGIAGISSGTVSGCTNNGDITANGSCVGGIVGTQKNTGTVSGCTNCGNISNGESETITSNYGTGGIVGWTQYAGDGNFTSNDMHQIVVTDCTNNGNVSTDGTGSGGIVGMAYHSITVKVCKSGTNNDVTISGFRMVGGIVGGCQQDSNSKHCTDGCYVRIIDNSCSGSVTLKGDDGTVGAIVGHLTVTSSDNTCTNPHDSFSTVIGNTSDVSEDMEEVFGGGETAATVTVDDVEYGYPTFQAAVNNAPHGCKVTLVADVDESITISGNVTIDLNGKTIGGDKDASTHTIIVKSGASLTIDATGGGVVDCTVHGKACLENEGGDVTINGGTFIRSAEMMSEVYSEWVNSWYVIDNKGMMTINGGTFISGYPESDGYYLGNISSIVMNNGGATLTIEDGDFIGAAVSVRNNGTMTINGGSFSMDNTEHKWVGGNNIILNSGTATLTGGKYSATGPGAAIDDDDWCRHGIYNEGTATISGISLRMEGDYSIAICQSNEATGDMTISNSSVSVSSDPTNHLINAPDNESDKKLKILSGEYTGTFSSATVELVISGGTFDSNIDHKYMETGFTSAKSSASTWDVIEGYGVASVGSQFYTTLQLAVNEAGSSTVTLNADSSENLIISGSASISIGSYDMTGSVTVAGSLSITGTGTVSSLVLSTSGATVTVGGPTVSSVSDTVSNYYVTSSTTDGITTYSLARSSSGGGSGGGSVTPPVQPDEPETDVEEHPDGSTTETTTDTTTNPDGSKTETTTVTEKDPEGNVTGSTSTSPTTTTSGNTTTVVEVEEVRDADDKVTSSTEKVTETTRIEGGTMISETTQNKDSAGNVTSSTETVTAESDDGSVKTTSETTEAGTTVSTVVTVTESGTVPDSAIDAAIGQSTAVSDKVSAENPDRVIQFSSDGTAADVTVTPESMAAIAETGAEFRVTCETGSMHLDRDVVTTLTQPKQDVNVSMSESNDEELTDAQVASKGGSFGVIVTATVGLDRVHQLGGTATITIPYLESMGADPTTLGVYYIDDDGVRTFMESVFDGGLNAFVFHTDHFSLYVVDEVPAPAESDDTLLYAGVVIVAIVVIAAAAVLYKKH